MIRQLESELGFTAEEIDGCLERQGLLSLELEFTKRCNLRCIYCYASAGEALDGEMDTGEILGVVSQARALGAKTIILLGGGEPLIHPAIAGIIGRIHAMGLSQVLFTNGMLLTEEICRLLRECRVAVVVKHNSFRPEVQDALAGVSGAHRLIRRGLGLLMDAGYPGKDHHLGIQSIICRQNRDEIVKMWVWARERGITPYFEVLTNQGRARSNPQLNLSLGEIRDLFQGLAEVDRERFGVRWTPRPPIAAFSCRRHLYSCLVNSQGHVQPCTGIDLSVGNVREKPLGDILKESGLIRDLRRIRETVDPSCRSCRYRGECYGCRGNAYQATGDPLAADPACWVRSCDATEVCG